MSGSQSQLPRNWQPWPAHEMISVPVGRDSIQKQKAYYGRNRGHSSNCVRVEERKRPSQSSYSSTSRLLKNVWDKQFLSPFASFSSAERFFASLFSRCRAPHVVVSAMFRDTTARTYCAGTVTAISVRMRTRL